MNAGSGASRRVLLLAVLLAVIALVFYLKREPPAPESERPLIEAVKAAESALRAGDPRRALAAIERAQAHAGPALARRSPWIARLYLAKGAAHWGLWQFIEAEQAWQKSLVHAGARERGQIKANIDRVARVLEGINTERNTRDRYLASPAIGPAGSLSGRVAVAYLLVRDADSDDWGLRPRSSVLRSWLHAQQWLAGQAARYGADVSFHTRVFLIDRHPILRKLKAGSFGDNFRHTRTVFDLALRQLGAQSAESFLRQLREEEGADQAMLVLHVNRKDRSFARRCIRLCSADGEYAFLFESTEPRRWQSVEYAQAHETLHLFGADDLYKIEGAKYYAVRDIMNYPSRELRDSSMEPITAFAVGLIEDAPEAPFGIVSR